MPHVLVKDLPKVIRAALDSVDYNRKDVEVKIAKDVVLAGAGGGGRRDFATLINLTTEKFVTEYGSWGGQNMFNRTNAVDNDDRSFPLPRDGAALKGSQGGGKPVYVTVSVHADVMPKIVTAGNVELSDIERDVLAAFKGYTSAYRKDWFARKGIRPEVFTDLAAKGMIKIARNGAMTITTDGKNAVGNHRVY